MDGNFSLLIYNWVLIVKIRPLMDGNECELGQTFVYGVKIRPLMDGNFWARFYDLKGSLKSDH